MAEEFRLLSTMTEAKIVLLFLVLIAAVSGDSTLKLVNLVYRHGDRSPVVIYPTDPNQADKWPQGLGWLSKTGMRQHHALGQWLRRRYIDTGFMGPTYKHEEIKIEASDEDRCLMSAYSHLSGFYPPSDDEKFNVSIPWQPIPVHTRPTYEDKVLNMGENCPRYNDLMVETMKSHAVTKEEIENKAFYAWLGNLTHVQHENISNIWQIADTLLCEKKHNLTPAYWVNDTVYQKLRTLNDFQFTLLFKGQEKSRLKGGPLLGYFRENMQRKSTDPDKNKQKMFMYSAHDTTVAALLSALQLFDGKSPEYTATVIAELHEMTTGKFVVRLFYRNETGGDTTAYPLTLPKCTLDCPLDQFLELTKNVIPVNWEKECGLETTKDVKKSLAVASVIAIAEGALLVMLIVVLTVWCVRTRRGRGPVAFQRFDVQS